MSASPDSPGELPFISHLLELRDRLLRMVVAVLVLFLGLIYFANDIYAFVANPLIAVMPEGAGMIATEVLSPFLTPFKLTLVVSVFLAMPYLLYQLWAFVAPGLYQHEKKMAMPLVASSILLFYAGAAFAYFVVFKMVFGFLVSVMPEGVSMMTDIRAYLDFVLRMFFAFGLAFEIPIATIILVWMGMTTPQQLAAKRPYIIVVVFILGMLLTPPDVISQTLLALPMWLLFECGVFFSRSFVRKREEGEEGEEGEEDEAEEQAAQPARAAPAAGEQEGPLEPEPMDADGFYTMSDEEMEAELDRIEAEEAEEETRERAEAAAADQKAAVDAKLERANIMRDNMDFDTARRLLHEVLAEGDDVQVAVARNILAQLEDED
jgi:sec-independent protein translocase protein TatC